MPGADNAVLNVTIHTRAAYNNLLRLRGAIRYFRGSLNKTQRSLKSFNSSLYSHRLAARIAVASMGLAVKAAANFDERLRRINTVARLNETMLQSMGSSIQKLAITYGKSANDIAEAMFEIHQASIRGNNAMVVLRQSLNLAVAGVSDVKSTAKILSSFVNTYGISVRDLTKVSDILFATQTDGVVTISELTKHLGKLIPMTKASGISIYEMAAALSVLTKQSVPIQMASTGLRTLINKLVKAKSPLNEFFKEYGGSAKALESRGLLYVLKRIFQLTKGRPAGLSILGSNIRDMLATAGITSQRGFSQFIFLLEKFQRQSKGLTSRALSEMMKSLSIDLNRAKEAIIAFSVKFASLFRVEIKDGVNTLIKFLDKLFLYIKQNKVLIKDTAKALIQIYLLGKAIKLLRGGFSLLGSAVRSVANVFLFFRSSKILGFFIKFKKLITAIKALLSAGFLRAVASFFGIFAGAAGLKLLGIGGLITAVALIGYYIGKWIGSLKIVKNLIQPIADSIFMLFNKGSIQKGLEAEISIRNINEFRQQIKTLTDTELVDLRDKIKMSLKDDPKSKELIRKLKVINNEIKGINKTLSIFNKKREDLGKFQMDIGSVEYEKARASYEKTIRDINFAEANLFGKIIILRDELRDLYKRRSETLVLSARIVIDESIEKTRAKIRELKKEGRESAKNILENIKTSYLQFLDKMDFARLDLAKTKQEKLNILLKKRASLWKEIISLRKKGTAEAFSMATERAGTLIDIVKQIDDLQNQSRQTSPRRNVVEGMKQGSKEAFEVFMSTNQVDMDVRKNTAKSAKSLEKIEKLIKTFKVREDNLIFI